MANLTLLEIAEQYNKSKNDLQKIRSRNDIKPNGIKLIEVISRKPAKTYNEFEFKKLFRKNRK